MYWFAVRSGFYVTTSLTHNTLHLSIELVTVKVLVSTLVSQHGAKG